MAFGIEDFLNKSTALSTKEAAQSVTEAKSEVAKDFCTADFCDKSLDNENIQESLETTSESVGVTPLDVEFAPEKFSTTSSISETTGFTDGVDESFAKFSEQSSTAKPHNTELSNSFSNTRSLSDISFGNLYDDRTMSFLKDCEKYGINLPTSVTHAGSHIDRHTNGGLLGIDKSIIKTSLDNALANNKISQEVYDKLRNKLSSC